jgi:hypothetical protein
MGRKRTTGHKWTGSERGRRAGLDVSLEFGLKKKRGYGLLKTF